MKYFLSAIFLLCSFSSLMAALPESCPEDGIGYLKNNGKLRLDKTYVDSLESALVFKDAFYPRANHQVLAYGKARPAWDMKTDMDAKYRPFSQSTVPASYFKFFVQPDGSAITVNGQVRKIYSVALSALNLATTGAGGAARYAQLSIDEKDLLSPGSGRKVDPALTVLTAGQTFRAKTAPGVKWAPDSYLSTSNMRLYHLFRFTHDAFGNLIPLDGGLKDGKHYIPFRLYSNYRVSNLVTKNLTTNQYQYTNFIQETAYELGYIEVDFDVATQTFNILSVNIEPSMAYELKYSDPNLANKVIVSPLAYAQLQVGNYPTRFSNGTVDTRFTAYRLNSFSSKVGCNNTNPVNFLSDLELPYVDGSRALFQSLPSNKSSDIFFEGLHWGTTPVNLYRSLFKPSYLSLEDEEIDQFTVVTP